MFPAAFKVAEIHKEGRSIYYMYLAHHIKYNRTVQRPPIPLIHRFLLLIAIGCVLSSNPGLIADCSIWLLVSEEDHAVFLFPSFCLLLFSRLLLHFSRLRPFAGRMTIDLGSMKRVASCNTWR